MRVQIPPGGLSKNKTTTTNNSASPDLCEFTLDNEPEQEEIQKARGISPLMNKGGQERLRMIKDASSQILKENDNLNMQAYKPFMNEFHKNSRDMFELDDDIWNKSCAECRAGPEQKKIGRS